MSVQEKQRPSFWEKKKKRKESIVASHPLYCFSPLESHEWYAGVELLILQGHLSPPHTCDVNKRNKMCSENQKCIINGPMKTWHYSLIQWWEVFSQFSYIIWNIYLNSCSGSSLSSNLICMFTLGIYHFFSAACVSYSLRHDSFVSWHTWLLRADVHQ